MKRSTWVLTMMVAGLLVNGCGTNRVSTRSKAAQTQQASALHRDTIERIVPEDAPMTRERLNATIEAVRTVQRDIPQEELPFDGNAVRKVLQDFSQSELDRVESLIPGIEKRRRAQGLD